MSHEIKIHDAQTAILRELLFHPQANFSTLQKKTGMTSDHFNFHVQKLVELGLVEKITRGEYALTSKGKEHANKLDTDNNTIERQPKVAVLMVIEKQEGGQTFYLFQERLKQPYFGFWCCPTGKVRWGETIIEAAERELMEETGLSADFRLAGTYHELVYEKASGDQLEDKIFFVVHCTNVKGKLITKFEGGRNAWMTRAQARKQEKIFSSFDLEIDMVTGGKTFIELREEYTKEVF